jgi:hypothetical protein
MKKFEKNEEKEEKKEKSLATHAVEGEQQVDHLLRSGIRAGHPFHRGVQQWQQVGMLKGFHHGHFLLCEYQLLRTADGHLQCR